jgi:tetratricopeptide (TPR) repeat protein
MRRSLGRVVLAAACLIGLAGCQTTSTSDNPFAKLGSTTTASTDAPDADTTGSVLPPGPKEKLPPLTPDLLGADPLDDLNVGKKYFRQGSFGLAERHFRKAVELHQRDAESWIGLAASYDRLKRFDLADRAYSQAIKLIGQTPAIMNNQGFSYMLRGDYQRARAKLTQAIELDPTNPYIRNNLDQLERSMRGGGGRKKV